MLDLGGSEGGEEAAKEPSAALGLLDELGVGTTAAGEMEELEHGLELLRGDGGRLHCGPLLVLVRNGRGNWSRAMLAPRQRD